MIIIDCAARIEAKNGKLQASDWLEEMERAGIAHAVIAASDEFVTVYNEQGNRQILELARRYPEKLSGLAAANPWYGEKALEQLEEYLVEGLKGLYLNPQRQGFLLTEKIVHPLIKVCDKYAAVVYCHTGTPVCSMPFQLANLARTFPRVKFVMGHAAWSDFSGYDVFPAARQADNIFVETSCGGKGLVRRLTDELAPERVLFGSGYPRSNARVEINKLKSLNLSGEIENKIFYENARNLWNLDLSD